MDLIDAEREVAARVAALPVVDPTGGGTHREVGGPPPGGAAVRAPAGVVTYDPAELTITVGAGATARELADVLGEADQECPLDPRDAAATIGGTLATGLSGHRRLRYGPLRDRVLEVRFATADGRLVRGGGPTVKNVTGYDIPRLLVGSLGTIGVITRVILRCQPRPARIAWFRADDPDTVLARCLRPSSILWRGGGDTVVLLEGHPDDLELEARAAGLEPVDERPPWPAGPHRGRISVAPRRLEDLGRALSALGDAVVWCAEWGVGTVHVAAPDEAGLAAARAAAGTCGGWLLREAGAPDLDGFGGPLPNVELMARVKAAFDPTDKLAPGRLPFSTRPLEVATP
jgi:glycolate oxidase FAD binding subunit